MMLIPACIYLLFSIAFAGTTVHYFQNPSCDINSIGDYSDSSTVNDLACHITPHNITKAIYIDGIDDGCAVITYSDYSCTPARARHRAAHKDECFYSSKGGLLRSWRNVCGQDLIAASASFASIRATAVHSTTSTASWKATSISVATITSASTWTSWNGTSNVTWSSTSTQTKSIPVQATVKADEAHSLKFSTVYAAIAIIVVLGGNLLS